MSFEFKLPDVGEGTAEAEIGVWHVAPGDRVQEDQLLVDVMTDKATVEMTSPVTGTVVSIHGDAGQKMPVGALLVVFELDGETRLDTAPAPTGQPARAAAQTQEETTKAPISNTATGDAPALARPYPLIAAGRETQKATSAMPLASPSVRKAAYERGIPLQFLTGTGPEGRILMADLDRPLVPYQVVPLQAAPGAGAQDEVKETRIIGLRRRIAENMQESKRHIPHFGYVEEIDLTELEELRSELNATRSPLEPKLTLLPFFVRAVVQLLPEFPAVNSRFDDAEGVLRTHKAAHIGIATQTPSGLMVPVIRHAERLNIWECASELARVTQAAREGTARREELTGSTITLTSLGPLGGISATPIINYPEVAIIGPNKLVEQPVVHHGQIVIRKMMNISSSFDHRIIDGYEAARFIHAMKRLMERPSLLFVERLK